MKSDGYVTRAAVLPMEHSPTGLKHGRLRPAATHCLSARGMAVLASFTIFGDVGISSKSKLNIHAAAYIQSS